MTTDDSGKETEGIFQCPECDSYNDAAHYSRRKGGVMCQVSASSIVKAMPVRRGENTVVFLLL
jgi:hypothetical protein